MNSTMHPGDGDVSRALRDSVSGADVPARPPLETITARGRAHQRRRITGTASLGAAGVAAGAALALSLTGAPGSSPAPAPGGGTGTIRTAAFTLTRNANGTDTLRLNMREMFNPAELQRALQRDGIPALVKTDVACTSDPAYPQPHDIGVLNIERPDGQPVGLSTPGHPVPIPPDAVEVINPARMPAGSELYFDYITHGLTSSLINARSYTCHAAPATAYPVPPGR